MAKEEVQIFRTWSSRFSLRVIWALKLKGIGYEEIFEELSNKSTLLLQYNPVYKKVPVLLHNGQPISESLVILEYADETWKQYPLLPQDPHERARARFWAKFGDEKIFPTIIYGVLLKQGEEQKEKIASAMENLKYLEEELTGKKFFGGEKIGFVDLALGWLAHYISAIEEVIGLKLIDQENFPLLLDWTQEFAKVPIIHESWPPRDKLVARYAGHRASSVAKETAN